MIVYNKEKNNDGVKIVMISSTLKALRKANGFTQAQIAEKLNIDRSTYSYYELGKINPGVGALITLAELYGISIDEIVNYNESAPSLSKVAASKSDYSALSEDESKLIASYRLLSNEAKEDVLISVVNIARDAQNQQ